MIRSNVFLQALLCSALWGQTASVTPRRAPDPQEEIVSKWGVRVSALRLTAADMMLDLRIRVLDVNKAEALFSNRSIPVVINPATGHHLEVPNTPTMGRLRPTRVSEVNRDYAIIFGNAFRQVRHGDKVKIQIGEFQADVTVE